MKHLSHNGVLIPKYEVKGFHVSFKGNKINLSSEQEEMAVAWVRKLGTEYVNDPVFVKNFFDDFRKALGIKERISPGDFDFSEIIDFVEKERQAKLNIPREEKKRKATERKATREANKEKYGYAVVDGEKVELGNYTVEPSSIFMGRGKHPLRGRWKEGAKENDIILNLSPNSKVPEGKWKTVVWDPDSMWIASWEDKLTGKRKYVWFSDTSPIKQEREIEKFDKAMELEKKFDSVKNYIIKSLDSEDLKIRKIATVCYLIDELCMRVGDEKDEDEADTVGATTLTKQNIKIMPDGLVKFDFLGKDSVRWEKDIKLPENVVRNLKEFIESAKDAVFEGVRSEHVNAFLNGAMEGLTTKVFRTFNASKTVKEYLEKNSINEGKSEFFKKYIATMANLRAAMVCNHKRKLPKKWEESLQKKKDSLEKMKEKIKERTKAKRKGSLKKSKEKLKNMKLRIELMRATRDYNLGTSLKSYIDPRVYKKWAKKVDYDWKKYYSKTLQRKFSWLDREKANETKSEK